MSVVVYVWQEFAYNNVYAIQASSEIRSNFILGTFPLCDLDADKLFKSLCLRRWGYYPNHDGCLEEIDLNDASLGPVVVSQIGWRSLA